MTIYGLKESVVATLIRRLCDDDTALRLDREAIAERVARAAWTGIAEPGDRMAGSAVAQLGASPALDALLAGNHGGTAVEGRIRALREAGLAAADEDLATAVARWSPRLDPAVVLRQLEQAVRLGVRLLVPGDPHWPTGVDDLALHAPLALWVRGDVSAVSAQDRSIALVGARAATVYGEHVTMEASAGLVDRGYTIVSGAAYGIDGMAHRAAIASSGSTVAYLAGGVDRFYPAGHDALLARIVETGAVVSELPCGSSPTKWRFLQRNRLIAAASLATVVLEAGWRSGSLNTAGHAAALGRPLGAVPGPVTSAASAGCHRLIREFDAVCVTTPDEMAELAPLAARVAGRGSTGIDVGAPVLVPALPGLESSSEEVRVLDAVSSRSARSVDDIAARCGLSVESARGVLGLLDLDGRVVKRESGWVRASAASRAR